MADIQRPIKAYGTRKYASETAAAPGNKAPILASEVDLDLDTIYDAWNNGVDAANIATGSISSDKLAPNSVTSDKILNFTIAHDDLGNDCVSSNNIVNGTVTSDELATDSVITVKIKDLNVTGPKLVDEAVTKYKMALGASLWTFGANKQGDADSIALSNGQIRSNYLVVNGIQQRNPFIPVFVRVHAFGVLNGVGPTDTFYEIRLKQDFTEIRRSSRRGLGVGIAWALYFEDVVVLADAGVHNFQVDIVAGGVGNVIVNGGGLHIIAPA